MNENSNVWKTDEGKYYTEIEEYLGRKRGHPVLLSVKEWYIAKCWHEEGIPISIIKEAIDIVARQKDIQNERISLAYCNSLVMKLWKDYKSVFYSKAVDEKEPEIQFKISEKYVVAHLENLIEQINQIVNNLTEDEQKLKSIFLKVIIKLNKIKEKYIGKKITAIMLEKIESALTKIEKKMLNDLIDSMPSYILDKLLDEAKETMQRYNRVLSDISYKRGLVTYVKKRILEEFKVPKLSIYAEIIKREQIE